MRSLMTPEKLQTRMGVAAQVRATTLADALARCGTLATRMIRERRQQGLEFRNPIETRYSVEVWNEARELISGLESLGDKATADALHNALTKGGPL